MNEVLEAKLAALADPAKSMMAAKIAAAMLHDFTRCDFTLVQGLATLAAAASMLLAERGGDRTDMEALLHTVTVCCERFGFSDEAPAVRH